MTTIPSEPTGPSCTWCDRPATERLPLTGEPVCRRCARRNAATYVPVG